MASAAVGRDPPEGMGRRAGPLHRASMPRSWYSLRDERAQGQDEGARLAESEPPAQATRAPGRGP